MSLCTALVKSGLERISEMGPGKQVDSERTPCNYYVIIKEIHHARFIDLNILFI